jgi:uncharacterized protein YcbK (DUF882 family)
MPSRVPINRLVALREEFGKPMIITSGVRCDRHNKKIGGARNSYHLAGAAFDVKLPSKNDLPEFIYLAYKNGFKGIGVINQDRGIIHIDCREKGVWIKY